MHTLSSKPIDKIMTETSYKYQQEMAYRPFKKRIIRATRSLLIIQGIVLAVFISFSYRLNSIYLLLFALSGILLSSVLFLYRIRKRVFYFLKGIRITNDHIVSLELYRKNEKFDHQLNLESLDVALKTVGGGRSGRLTFIIEFSYEGKLLGKQSDLGKWKSGQIKELFSTIKNFKGEALTSEEASLLKTKRGFLK
ncbi:hypothetical protein M23134_05069 [Microscilla marina ATCC 23134]|uniref:Uncharacterized protein n=2 Tax=Microscilla marina TaxID=1027 RepID=A1ZD24_MICM2|nr:hypothetical protein M23134_05069 [Microscilla marina ATCC 23134]